MTHLVRVYHQPSNEPFDLTPEKASHLVLNHGWTQTKTVAASAPVVSAEPVVETFDPVDEEAETHIPPSWRGTTGRRGRKIEASEENAEA